MNDNDEIKLHDYFDNLLSKEEQKNFEDTLLDNIDLAIDLGKLKNLQRNLRNLPSNFEPREIVIENIIDSLLEEKSKVLDTDIKSESEPKKEKKKKREIKKERKGLKALTKFRLKRLLTFSIFILFISAIGAGYYYFQKKNSTFPWKVSVLSKNISQNTQKILPLDLSSGTHLLTSKNDSIKITIADKGIFELFGESDIKIISGAKSFNSVLLKKGKLIFTPQIGNILFMLEHNNVIIKSKNSQFEIEASNNATSIVDVLTSFIEIELKEINTKVPYNHTFQIFDNNNISLPLVRNASKKFGRLIHKFDIEKNDKTLRTILKLSTRYNAFTLHFLLQKVNPANRELVIKKLNQFFPLPNSITKIDVLMLDNAALNIWWEDIYRTI